MMSNETNLDSAAIASKMEVPGLNEIPDVLRSDPMIMKALGVLAEIASNPVEMAIYEAEVKELEQRRIVFEWLKEEGLKEGMCQVLLHQMAHRFDDFPKNLDFAVLGVDPRIRMAGGVLEEIDWRPKNRVLTKWEIIDRKLDKSDLVCHFEAARKEGMQRALLLQLAHRIGEVPENIVRQLRELKDKQLLDLGVALDDFTSYADVEAWLTRH